MFRYPADGLLIWHIDARVDGGGRFLHDNSYTDRKLIRLMEADGLEEIEQNFGANAGDFYTAGDVLSGASVPNSDRYDGSPTNLLVNGIARTAGLMAFDVDLGSGCGIFADLSEPVTAWPGIKAPFRAGIEFANCGGTAPIEWTFSDGSGETGDTGDHSFNEEGVFSWALRSSLGDASLTTEGEVLVCADPRCLQWRPVPRMTGARLQHSAVELEDGRVLVVGGGARSEVFDPRSDLWGETSPSNGVFSYASAQRLNDGRVLVTGSHPGSAVNAEIYDPVTDSWTVAMRMFHDRVMHSSVRLVDGRVLVAGGHLNGVDVAMSEVYDPARDQWTPAGGIGFESVPGLAVLPDDEVLFVGKRVTRIFNPVTDEWRRISDTVHEHKWGATATLPDGRVMVIGGEGIAGSRDLRSVSQPLASRTPLEGDPRRALGRRAAEWTRDRYRRRRPVLEGRIEGGDPRSRHRRVVRDPTHGRAQTRAHHVSPSRWSILVTGGRLGALRAV